MIEVRLHGRGGQGTQIACEILASAFLKEGKYVQAMPVFGTERRGAPVTGHLRADGNRILMRGPITEPEYLVILDEALRKTVPIISGLRERGLIVINSIRAPEAFDFSQSFRVAVVDANSIAKKHSLGTPLMPIVNTVMLGAFAGATRLIGLDALLAAIRAKAPVRPEDNAAAAEEAYGVVRAGGYASAAGL